MNAQYYKSNSKFLVAADCIIFGFKDKELHVLLTRRPVEPMAGEWSLMGGFVDESESWKMLPRKCCFVTRNKKVFTWNK